MSKTSAPGKGQEAGDAEEEELDEWDKRIFSTGCSQQTKLNDCYFDKKDWRACKKEPAASAFTTRLARNDNLLMLYDRCRWTFSASVGNGRATIEGPKRKIHDSAPPKRTKLRHDFRSTRVYQAQQARMASTATAPSDSPQQQPRPATDRFQPKEEVAHTDDLTAGLGDQPIVLDEKSRQVDWARSFHGLSTEAFSKEAAHALLAPLEPEDIEVKPDGIVYLPEIKYRRILNRAFGPGAWGLAPRGETIVTAKAVTREYALVALGRLVSVARGEQDYFTPEGIPTAVEGCKSNALMRCCKDLGVASELWDPRFIRKFIADHAKEVWVEHQQTQKRRKIWMRKDDQVRYPFKLYVSPPQGSARANNSKY
ncbi:MAG: hypothetical protein LQ345_006518 [Seirophora villosa]|nr:MAG: hypothetical protein LQ345_006518 [Seirophora villosa]